MEMMVVVWLEMKSFMLEIDWIIVCMISVCSKCEDLLGYALLGFLGCSLISFSFLLSAALLAFIVGFVSSCFRCAVLFLLFLAFACSFCKWVSTLVLVQLQ